MSRCAFTREGSQSDRLVELLVFFVVCCWVVVYLDFFFKTPLRLFTPGILKEVGHRLVAEFEIARATDPAPFQDAIWFEMTLKDMHLFFFVIFVIFDVAVNNMERDPTQRLDFCIFLLLLFQVPWQVMRRFVLQKNACAQVRGVYLQSARTNLLALSNCWQ